MAPNRVSGLVVKTVTWFPLRSKFTSAPVDFPIQLVWSSLIDSGQSRGARSSMRRCEYFVMRSIHCLSGRRSTVWPLAFHSSTSSFARTVPRSGDQLTGASEMNARRCSLISSWLSPFASSWEMGLAFLSISQKYEL